MEKSVKMSPKQIAIEKAKEAIAATQDASRAILTEQLQAPKIGGILSKVKFIAAPKAETVRAEKANASVRQNGQVVFNATATKIIGFPEIAIAAIMDGETIVTPASTKGRTYFRVGNDDEGNIYLVPETAETPDVLKATKNNDGMQFRRDDVFAGMGAKYKDSYAITAETDEDGTEYFKLTLHREEPVAKVDSTPVPPETPQA